MSGAGVAAGETPSITAQPASQTAASGRSVTFSVAAASTAPLSYQWRKNGTLIAGAISTTYTTPPAATQDNGSHFDVAVTNSTGTMTSDTATLTVIAAAVVPPTTLAANPANVNFDSIPVGRSRPQIITLTNSGTNKVTISETGTSGAGFSISRLVTPLTISAGQTTAFSANFSPVSPTVASGSISITSDAPGSPLTIALRGNGIQPPLSATPSIVGFGNVATGTRNSQTITLTNEGSTSTTISQASLSGKVFGITGLATPVTIAAGKSTTFNAVFAPTSAESVTGSVSLVSDASSPLAVSLSGTGVNPTLLLEANPTRLIFGNVNVESNSSLAVVLTNRGNSSVTIASVTDSGSGFRAGGVDAGTRLTPGQSVALNIAFTPVAVGDATGSVSVVSNATNSSISITLIGSGQPTALQGQWITGYYSSQNGVLPVSSIPWSKYTHIIHFAAAPGVDLNGNGNGTVELHWLSQADITALIAARPIGKRVIVCIKDNDSQSQAFAQSTAPAMIAAFVANITNFVNTNQYDGVDLDWEQNINVTQYNDLLTRLRTAMPAKVITMAVGNFGGLESVAGASYSRLDQINLMCYDMDGPSNGYSWYNDALLQSGNLTVMTCDWRAQAFTNAGVAASKIGIGIPFYGRRWPGATRALVRGSFNPSTVLYRDLANDGTRWQPQYQFYDNIYKSDYLSVPSLNEFNSYNGARSIKDAVTWQKSQGFGGFMTFTVEYEYLSSQVGDARYPLSTTLCKQVLETCQ